MNKHVISFGGNPIYVCPGNRKANEKELNHLRRINRINNKERTLKLTDDSQILKNKKLEGIEKIILKNFNDYTNNILQIDNSFYICNSWSTYQKKGDHHPSHKHANAIFSAVYYAKVEKTSLVFLIERSKLNENFYFAYNIKNYNEFNSSSWRVDVTAGDVIIFPGHIRHQTPVCEDDERLMVGTSFFIKGKLGCQEDYNDINLKI